jgi:uncharacterized protein
MSEIMWRKVKMHIFEIEGDIIAFDVFRSRPHLIDELDRAVLRLRSPIEEERAYIQICHQHDYSLHQVRASIARLEEMRMLVKNEEDIPAKPKEADYPEVSFLELNIAEDCNIRCAYCCVGQGGFGADVGNGRKRGVMNWEIARQAIDLLFVESLDSPEVHIRFFGGEPMMNWPIIRKGVLYAEEKAQKVGKKVGFSTVTNATLLTQSIIDFMKEHNFWVQVSIDGTPEMHNAYRVDINQIGTYDSATRYVPNLIEALGTDDLQGRGTVTHNDPDLVKAFEHLRSLGFDAPEIRPVTGHDTGYGMTIADYMKYNQGASEVAKKLLTSSPDDAHHYMALFSAYMSQLMSGQPRRPPCGAGRNMIGVSTDGKIFPCTDMIGKQHKAIQFGDMQTGLNRKNKEAFLKIVDVDNKVGCSSCWARYVCSGACASVELSNEGGLERNAGIECIWIRHVIELTLWLYVRMLRDRPDLFYSMYAQETKIDLGPLMDVFAVA